ncbi:unnamed protein product [Bursaphelenchus xylophilus]|uniref:(pine wood nematode) hypothetical protein n=1 Tax=Bursaphelenchus xylophilus TaxID=6326 RepID=A0A1I7RLC3_BURXY|nr:unnamed protein product [Bursaphelenchus xylophilus]CAG9083167.1 unnamed protein product [Bursaphelenchus xylophilus]
MFDGVYSYFFGSEESSANVDANGERQEKGEDWVMVDSKSGRSSPVLVAEPHIDDLDDMISEVSSQMPSQQLLTATEIRRRAKAKEQARKEELKRKVRATIQHRQWLEEKLFEDPDASSNDSPPPSAQNSPPGPQKPLDKLILAQPTRKQKRAKKTGKNVSDKKLQQP